MGIQSTMIERGLLARESSDFGGSFVHAAGKGPCSLSVIGFGARLVDGGFSPHSEVTIAIRKSVLDTTFKTGQPIEITDGNGDIRDLKIASQGITDGIFFWELICNDPRENA
jgi:hypothetical protein